MAGFSEMERINRMLCDPAARTMSDGEILGEEIREFKAGEGYRLMLEAERYYRNRSAVQDKVNPVRNRSNTRIEHPIVKKLVDQKADYLMARPFAVKASCPEYAAALADVFDARMRRKLKAIVKTAVKQGVAWAQPYIKTGAAGRAAFDVMLVPPVELVPIWSDAERSELSGGIRFFDEVVYAGNVRLRRPRAEVWTRRGVQRYFAPPVNLGVSSGVAYSLDTAFGCADDDYTEPWVAIGGKAFVTDEVPLCWMRGNDEELPLHYFIKELVDDINWQTSVTADMLRDIAQFIFVLKDYGGQDLAEFLRDLQNHRAVKVSGTGGVEKLQAQLDIDAVMQFLKKNRADVIYYANSVDTGDADLGNASGQSINFRYMDLDSSCVALAGEMQEMLRRMKLFIDIYLQAAGKGDFSRETFEVVFNMDMPVNEGDVIDNVAKWDGISLRTRLENHPWVTDVEEEMRRLEGEGAE